MGLTLSQNVIVLVHTLTVIPLTQGIPRFTQEPPGVVYVSSGGTARLVWDYYVRNRTLDLDPFSPQWALYNTSGTKILIGYDNGFNNWTFIINRECPSRVRNRISKESTATLVISNVTIADSGIYECNLMLTAGSPKTSKTRIVVTVMPPRKRARRNPTPSDLVEKTPNEAVNGTAGTQGTLSLDVQALTATISVAVSHAVQQALATNKEASTATSPSSGLAPYAAPHNDRELTVETAIQDELGAITSEPPHFNISLSPITAITEGSSLRLQCSATGNPLPNVTWVRIQDDVMINEGHGEALLRIVNITRQQSGTYECRAANNPNEDPVTIRTEISVKFSPEPEPTNVTVSEIQGKTVNNIDYVNIEKATQFSKVLAGVIGVIIFLLLVSTAVLVVLIKKMCARKKERKIRNESNKKSLDPSVPGIYGTCQEEEEIQSPENVDFEKMAEVNQEETVPIYAQIDKSKKRRPGQVVYAEILGSETQEEALSSGPVQLPPKYVETQYADIDTNQLGPKCHIDPLYEILNGD